MTTVAFKNGILAADTQRTINDTIGRTTKLYRTSRGWVGLTGNLSLFKRWLPWFESGDWSTEPPPLTDDKDALSGLWLNNDGQCYVICSDGVSPIPLREPFALGSGMGYAIGAMCMGADATQAVAVAAEFDPCTGGPYNVVRATDTAISTVYDPLGLTNPPASGTLHAHSNTPEVPHVPTQSDLVLVCLAAGCGMYADPNIPHVGNLMGMSQDAEYVQRLRTAYARFLADSQY